MKAFLLTPKEVRYVPLQENNFIEKIFKKFKHIILDACSIVTCWKDMLMLFPFSQVTCYAF